MRIYHLFFFFLIGLCSSVSAQVKDEQKGTIDLNDREGYYSFPRIINAGGKSDFYKSQISLFPYLPNVYFQDTTKMCAAIAGTYYGFTAYKALKSDTFNIDKVCLDEMAFSPIYSFIKAGGDCNKGIKLSAIMKSIKKDGACLNHSFTNATPCDLEINENWEEEAKRHRLKKDSVYRLFDEGVEKETKLEVTLTQLKRHNPVIVSFKDVPDRSVNKHPLFLWEPKVKRKIGHAMVVIGFDNNSRLLELINSYGPKWGKNGRCYMSYEAYKEYVSHAYIFHHKGAKGHQKILEKKVYPIYGSAQLEFESDEQITDSSFVFLPMSFQLDSKTIEYTSDKTWRVLSDRFKVNAKLPKGRCLYIFSITPPGIAHLHHETIYTDKDITVRIAIPGEDEFLLSRKGTTTVLALFSYKLIEDIEERLIKLTEFKGSVEDKIQFAFGDLLIRQEKINYDRNRSSFNLVDVKGNEVAVPIVFSIRGEN